MSPNLKTMKKMWHKKEQPRVYIYLDDHNRVTISGDSWSENIDVKNMSKWEQIEAVRGIILKMGLVFTPKIEKYVRKCLN